MFICICENTMFFKISYNYLAEASQRLILIAMVIFASKILICLLLRVDLLILENSLPQQMARIMIILISQSKLHKVR